MNVEEVIYDWLWCFNGFLLPHFFLKLRIFILNVDSLIGIQ
jgi:hypothetical protein